MKRSELNPLPEYFDRYINKCDDVELMEALDISINELNHLPIEKWESYGDKTYAEGKWTIKDILQHIIDAERVFTYRVMFFARGDQQKVPYYTEDDYAATADANRRTIKDLVEELKASHHSVKALYNSFTSEMLSKTGMGFKGKYSVADIGFMLPGHQRWHFDVIEEKYFNPAS